MDIGEHCNVCGQLDFLPFKCHRCGQIFCDSHRSHECSEAREIRTEAPSHTPSKPLREATYHSNKPSPATSQPKLTFDPPQKLSNSSTKQPERKPNNRSAIAALERFKQLVGVSASKRVTPPRATPVSLDMKRSAVGDKAVPVSNRVYFKVLRPSKPYKDPLTNKEAMRPSKEVNMYFDKMNTVGQMLDKASKHLGVHGKAIVVNDESIDFHCKASDLVQGTLLTVM